jgi:hypothetical protein
MPSLLPSRDGLCAGNRLKHNDLENVPPTRPGGMDPAFPHARESHKERYIDSVSSKRIPYVGMGG